MSFTGPNFPKGSPSCPTRVGVLVGFEVLLDAVHGSHGAEQMRVLHESAAWGDKSDFAAVSSHSAAAFLSWFVRVIVVDPVVIAA